MAKGICSEVGCEKAVLAKALCVTHYHRANRATKNERPPVGICRGCGRPVPRDQPGPPGHYCKPECRPRCDVDGCEKPRHGLTYCSAHHTRWKRSGDPLAPLQRLKNVGTCSVDDCDLPSRKLGLCTGHYSRLVATGNLGSEPIKRRMSPGNRVEPKTHRGQKVVLDDCVVCGKSNRVGRYQSGRFCSSSCQVFMSRHGGQIPPNPVCVRCEIEIDITTIKTKKRHRKRSDTKLCDRCKAQSRTEATPGQLALRDGPYCQLCGCDVDLLAVFPDKMRPSVDHIRPRAWGGTDDASNNQLTHLLCNQIKSDRYEGVSQRSSTALDRAVGR